MKFARVKSTLSRFDSREAGDVTFPSPFLFLPRTSARMARFKRSDGTSKVIRKWANWPEGFVGGSVIACKPLTSSPSVAIHLVGYEEDSCVSIQGARSRRCSCAASVTRGATAKDKPNVTQRDLGGSGGGFNQISEVCLIKPRNDGFTRLHVEVMATRVKIDTVYLRRGKRDLRERSFMGFIRASNLHDSNFSFAYIRRPFCINRRARGKNCLEIVLRTFWTIYIYIFRNSPRQFSREFFEMKPSIRTV